MNQARSILAAAAVFLAPGSAFAVTEEMQTVTSRVEVVKSPSLDMSSTTYKITGPTGESYVLDAPRSEVDRLVRVLETDPNATLSFKGQVIDGPQKTLRVSRWERSTSTTTSTTSDLNGTTTTHKSEETTSVR